MAMTTRRFSDNVTTRPTTGTSFGMTSISKPTTSSAINRTTPDRSVNNANLSTATPITGVVLGQQQQVETQEEQNPYYDAYAEYESKMNALAANQKAEMDKLYAEMAGNLNAGYDKSANNAYINYRQSQKALPEQLSQYGVTGGASESANLRLQAAYGDNLAENEYNRNSGLSDIRQNQIQQYSDINSDLNSALASAYQQAASQAIAWEQEQKEKAEAKAKEEAEKAEQAAIDNWNNSVMAKMLKRTLEGKEVQSWTESNGKIHYRVVGNNKKAAQQQAEALSDAIASAQKQALSWANAGYNVTTKTVDGLPVAIVTGKKNGSGGSSGGSSGRSSGGSSGGTSLPAVKSSKKKSAGSTPKSTGNYLQSGAEATILGAINAVQGLYNSGKITESQAKGLLGL